MASLIKPKPMSNILIIEDDLQYAEWFKIIFPKQNYNVFITSNIQEAKLYIENNNVDVILLDIILGEEKDSGYKFCTFVKSRLEFGFIPIIFVSALADVKDKKRGFDSGGDDYITKPFVPQELIQKVNVYIRIKTLQEELATKNKILEELSITDPLTGAFNRRFMKNKLDSEIERNRRAKTKFSLLMLDIDHFKMINDTFGHLAGDEVLKKMVEIIKTHIRKIDMIFRYGGEEFVVLLLNTVQEDTYNVAEKIRKSVAKHNFQLKDSNKRITISIGISNFESEQHKKSEELIKIADKNLYTAKESGRNQTVY